MPPTVQELFDTAIKMPLDMQSLLAEKLIGYVEIHVDSSLEKLHLAHSKQRRAEIQSGNVSSIDGVTALQKVRKLLLERHDIDGAMCERDRRGDESSEVYHAA